MGNDCQIVAELLFKLSQVADVVDAFVEPPSEFGRDGLQLNTFVGQHGQNHQQLGGVCGASVSSIETSAII